MGGNSDGGEPYHVTAQTKGRRHQPPTPHVFFDHGFGQAPPSMESIAALASSIVAYLPSSLYLALFVEVSSLPGMTRHWLVVLSTMR